MKRNQTNNRATLVWCISLVLCLGWQQQAVAMMGIMQQAGEGLANAVGAVGGEVGKLAGKAYQVYNRSESIYQGVIERAKLNKNILEQADKAGQTNVSGLQSLRAERDPQLWQPSSFKVASERTERGFDNGATFGGAHSDFHFQNGIWLPQDPTKLDFFIEEYNKTEKAHNRPPLTKISIGSKEYYPLPRGTAFHAVSGHNDKKGGPYTYEYKHVMPSDAGYNDYFYGNYAKLYKEKVLPIARNEKFHNEAIDENKHLNAGMDHLKPTNDESYYTEQDSFSPEAHFSTNPVELHSADDIKTALAMMQTTIDLYEKKLKKLEQDRPDVKGMTNQLIEMEGKAKAARESAREQAMIQAKSSRENMERLLKASPALALLGLGTFAGGVALKQVLPRLLGQKPQVIAEMSFRTPLEKLLGKKLPAAHIEKVIWAPKTGEKIMRFTRRIQRVIQRGGEMMNMIFYGPPGTGKTMTAKAVARASGAEYMIINGAAFEQLPPSKIIMELEGVFRLARTSKKPVLIFWDEADAALGKRGGEMESLASRRLINTFLSNVSDTHNSKLMFILATNLPNTLDDAVLSRFPQEGWIFFDRPELAERAKILRMYLHDFLSAQGLQLGDDTDSEMNSFAEELSTATGRDLRALARGVYDRMMDDDVSVLNPALVRKVISETQQNRDQIGQYVYGQ